MSMTESEPTVQTLNIVKETRIDAPIATVFETLLEPHGAMADLRMKIEPWPGGRWFRDLGKDTGHLWGHVQVIKPPTLLEVSGPMFMSYPAVSHIQYRLAEQPDGGTLLTLRHQAIGLISAEHMTGVNQGWGQIVDSIRAAAEAKRAAR